MYPSLKRFMSLLHRFHAVERVASVPTLTRQTNAAEHTYQLSMLAWYVASSTQLPFSLEKVLRYALAHDIVEAYAGDTFIHDAEGRETKEAREREATERIAREFPEFPELTETLHAYEERNDPESRFVYALDKLIDPLNSSMTTDRLSVWKEHNISYEAHHAYKHPKISISPEVMPLWEKLSEELLAQKDFFFPSSDSTT